MRRFLFLLVVLAAAVSAQNVTLTLPAVDSTGAAIQNGNAYISWPPFFDTAGTYVKGGQLTVPITNGSMTFTLHASDNAGAMYKVLMMGGSVPTIYQWKIPAAGATTIPQLSYSTPPIDNDCAKWLNGQVTDSGAPCGGAGAANRKIISSPAFMMTYLSSVCWRSSRTSP